MFKFTLRINEGIFFKMETRKAKFQVTLTYFQPMFHLHTPWKHQRISTFYVSGDMEVENWLKMG